MPTRSRRRELSRTEKPLTLLVGRHSHPSVHLVNEIIQRSVKNARLVDAEDAAHFMIATHPRAVADELLEHLHSTGG